MRNNSTTSRYLYDGENRLTAIEPTIPQEHDTNSTFVYDYLGRRVEKKVFVFRSNSWTLKTHTRMIYDGWNLVAEIDLLNSKETHYVWGLDLSQSLQGAGGIGGLLARVDDSDVYSYFYDANGNVVQLVDQDKERVAAYEYDPFGNTITIDGRLAEANPFRFSTKYFDAESGLYYYGYRFYSPELGRWINRDPIQEDGGLNLYAFVGNDGVNFWDKLGMLQGEDENSNVDFGTIDSLALSAIQRILEAGAFWQCFILGMPNEKIQALLSEIENDLPSTHKVIFREWMIAQSKESPQRFLALLVELQKPIRTVQGSGLVGSALRVGLGDKVYADIRKKFSKQTVRWAGKGGAKFFGRWGSKALPVVGQALLAVEGANACRCYAVTKNDGQFTSDETWSGLIGRLFE